MAKRVELKGTTEEREQFMFKVFEKFYSDPANKGKNLSINKANESFKAEYGSMLRNKKAYQLRDAAKAKLGLLKGAKAKEAAKNAPSDAKPVTEAQRPAQNGVAAAAEAAAERGAKLISGTPEQLQWLKEKVLPEITAAGMFSGTVDYSTDKYMVLAAT